VLAQYQLSVIALHEWIWMRSVEWLKATKGDWRELCAAAATEHDSTKLARLVDQIIKALDERRDAFKPAPEFGGFNRP
jgi:hypothetical protein